MEIVDVLTCNNPLYYFDQIRNSDWRPGPYLYDLFVSGELFELCGRDIRIFVMEEKGEVLAYCTYARWDEIKPTDLYPWIGFVYTYPKHRGKGYIRKLISYVESIAKDEGHAFTYISTDHTDLYEHFGYSLFTNLKNVNGEECRVYRKELR